MMMKLMMMLMMMIIIVMMMMVDLRMDGGRADRTNVGRGEGSQSRHSKFISEFLSSLSTAVDHCFSNPCANNGTCNNSLHGYRCSCPEGFTGSLCEEGKTFFLFVFTKIIEKKTGNFDAGDGVFTIFFDGQGELRKE